MLRTKAKPLTNNPMPKVGKKKYAYTPAGKKAAKKAAKKSGLSIKKKAKK